MNIFIVNCCINAHLQAQGAIFNKGLLMNAGFLEATKLDQDFDCFVFADVDLIPIHLCNVYACSAQPRHLAARVDVYEYK